MILHCPNGVGALDPLAKIQAISDHFKKDVRYDGVHVYESAKVLSPLVEPTEIMYPSTIRYRCF